MTPWQIAKDSESSHQIALFCFAAKAEKLVGIGLAYNALALGASDTKK